MTLIDTVKRTSREVGTSGLSLPAGSVDSLTSYGAPRPREVAENGPLWYLSMLLAALEAVLVLRRGALSELGSELGDCSCLTAAAELGQEPASVLPIRAFLLDAVGAGCFVPWGTGGAPKEKTGGQVFAAGSRASTGLAPRTHLPQRASQVPALLQGPQGHGEGWAGGRLGVPPSKPGQLFPPQRVCGRGTPVTLQAGRFRADAPSFQAPQASS